MHSFLRLKSRECIDDFCHLLEVMALDSRLYHGLSPFETSASAPSLRAAEPTALMAPQPIVDDAGHVKVVVRVREFVERGM
jgi:hypothetical protein